MVKLSENTFNVENIIQQIGESSLSEKSIEIPPEVKRIYDKIKEKIKDNKDELIGFLRGLAGGSSDAIDFKEKVSQSMDGYKTNV